MMADMESNEKLSPIVTELFLRGRKLNISLVFISQSYFKVLKTMIINGKNFYDQTIDSDTKQYEEIRKQTTGQGEYYTTGFLLDYDYIKNHNRLIAIDLSKEK